VSTYQNARRINLAFRISCPEQRLAYQTLCNTKSKTEYITRLILQDIRQPSGERLYTKSEISQIIADMLPQLMEQYTGRIESAAPPPESETADEKTQLGEAPHLDEQTEGLLLDALAGFSL
jgi:hypothetical protein